MEKTKGTADMQAELASSQVGVDIQTNKAAARKAEADGEASYIIQTGEAEGKKVLAIGMANAESYNAQVKALGQMSTAAVNIAKALADKNIKIMPDILVAGGGSSSLDGVAASLMQFLKTTPANATKETVPSTN